MRNISARSDRKEFQSLPIDVADVHHHLLIPQYATPPDTEEDTMETTKFLHWQDGNMWLGYLEEYPDYMTQGETLDELKENLKDLYKDLTSAAIPCVRKVAELEVA